MDETITRESMIFYRSFMEAMDNLEPTLYKEVMQLILHYAMDGEIPNNCSDFAKTIFTLIKAQIDANNTRYINGCKGGRPKNLEKTAFSDNDENQTKTEQKPNENQTETKHKPNVNVNDNDNVNDIKKERVERKKDEPSFSATHAHSETSYEALATMYGKEFVDERLERAKNYKAKDKMQLVAKWCAEDCQKNYSTRKKNGFNDFMQNNYDFDELEKILEQTPKINDDG